MLKCAALWSADKMSDAEQIYSDIDNLPELYQVILAKVPLFSLYLLYEVGGSTAMKCFITELGKFGHFIFKCNLRYCVYEGLHD